MGSSASDLSTGLKKIPPPIIICICCQSELSDRAKPDYNASSHEQESNDSEISDSQSFGGESDISAGLQTLRIKETGLD